MKEESMTCYVYHEGTARKTPKNETKHLLLIIT